MKILNICLSAPFTEHYTYQDNLLTEYQHKLGHEVVILTSTSTRDENGKIVETEPGEKILDNGVKLIRIRKPAKLWSILGKYSGLYQYFRKEEPDFIYIHGLCNFAPQSAVRYVKKHPDIHIVADNHQDEGTTYTRKFPFNLLLALYRMMWKKWIRKVDMVYGTTSWRKRFAREFYGIPEEKLDVLIMGVDSDRLPSCPQKVREEVRAELGIEDQQFMFVTGGKLDHFKKTIELMKAFVKLEDRNARLVIFGSAADEIKEEFFSLLERDSRIRYLGYVSSSEIHRYFYAGDFGMFPGRHSVLWEEAIGCGLPCLFRKYEEQDHTEVCGNCVRLTDAGEDEIYEVLNRALTDGEWYRSLKENADRAAETFSYRAIAEKSLEWAGR